MKFQYDDFVDKIVKHTINLVTHFGMSSKYLEDTYILKLYAKEFADSNLYDFANNLNTLYTKNMLRPELIAYIKKHYKIYLAHRM